MAVRTETTTTNETRTVAVTKAVGVTYASDKSERKLKITKSKKVRGAFVVTVENSGNKSIVIRKAQLQDFMAKAAAFVKKNA